MAAEPVRLDRPAEFVGEWWLPGAHGSVASGRLRFQPFESLMLEAVSSGGFLSFDEPVPWLLGLTVDGRPVTLRDLVVVDWRLSMPGGVLVKAHAREAFVGMHAASERDLRFHSLSARVANLAPWLDPPGLVAGEVAPGAPAYLGRVPGGVGATAGVSTRSIGLPPRKPLRLEVEREAAVRFAATRGRRGWSELRGMLGTFRAFVSLAAGIDSPLLEVAGDTTVTQTTVSGRRRHRGRETVWVLFRQREMALDRETRAEEMLFREPDARFRNRTPFGRWFRRASLMEPIYDLYAAALTTRPMFLEDRFLAFVRALEAYDFRRSGGERKLLRVVRDAVDGLPAKLRGEVPAGFPELVRDTRHYLTHLNPKYQHVAAEGERLFALTEAVRLLFELSMLRELGFGKQQVWALVEGNQRLVGVVRRGFHGL